MRKLLLVLMLGAAFTAHADDDKFRMKADQADTGSHLKRDTAISSLPFDKTYEQLTEAQKNQLRGVYEHMGPADEPPFPVHGLKHLFKGLEEVQRRLAVRGRLDVRVMVGPDGEPQDVKIYETPDPDLAKAVAFLLLKEKYKPALCEGKPCSQEFPFRVLFEMNL